MNFIEIAKAWITSLNPTEDQKKRSLERIEICNSCEKNKPFKGIYICSSCGCPISKKVFSHEYNPCPLKKWEAIDKNYLHLQKNTKTIL